MRSRSADETVAGARARLFLKPSANWLLVFVPGAVLIRDVPALHNEVALFLCAGLAIVPLAGLMGKATEVLAEHLGQGIGGLLNATFGNAAELIIALVALQKGLIPVVKASITGSIIGNLLLVLGMAMLAGGVRHPVQKFNRTAVRSMTSSLALAAIGLLIPTIFHLSSPGRPGGWHPAVEQRLSLAVGSILFLTYLCSLLFTLKTHRQLFTGPASTVGSPSAASAWSKTQAILVLLVATALVAWLSENLVDSVQAARQFFGFSEIFVGVVIVAIIGNAAEHSTAVMMALHDKMDLSLGIAIGSSQQVALFVAPVLLFASYAFGQPMTFEFSVPEVVAVITAVYVVAEISGDGESNWLEGTQLLSLYLILGVLFYFLPAAR